MMNKVKRYLVVGLNGAGAVIGSNAVVFRVLDLISYSEMKKAMLIALVMLGMAVTVTKFFRAEK